MAIRADFESNLAKFLMERKSYAKHGALMLVDCSWWALLWFTERLEQIGKTKTAFIELP